MEYYKQYIVTKRFKNKAICGDLNLPYGTKCYVEDGMICCDKGIICNVKSQNAYDFFTQNDDGCGKIRRKLINNILKALDKSDYNKKSYDEKWLRVWNDTVCQKYKRNDYENYWLWSYDFYNAEISDLIYIEKLVIKEGSK